MSKKIFITIIFILVVVSAILFLNRQNGEQPSIQNNNTPVNIINQNNNLNSRRTAEEVIMTQQVDSGINITNTIYNYSFIVPSDWQLDKKTSKADLVMLFDPEAQAQETDGDLIQGMKLEVYVDNYPGNSLADFSRKGGFQDYIVDEEEMTVSDLPAYQVTNEGYGYNINTYIIRDGTGYIISGIIANQEKTTEYTNIYQGIIQSFAFDTE